MRTCVPHDQPGHTYTRFRRTPKSGNAHQALDAAAELQRIGIAEALSLRLVIREDEPVLYDKAEVRRFASAQLRTVTCSCAMRAS